jgi:hypothetical protein
MKNTKTTLIKWLQTQGIEQGLSIGLIDNLIIEITPVCTRLRLNVLEVLKKASSQSNCHNLGQLKENIRFYLKKEILKIKRLKEEQNRVEEVYTPVSKETLEWFRTRTIN